MTLLTVCIITYNHESFIQEAINSVLEQKTDFEFEVVIADDCSTDDTIKILKNYKNLYPEKISLLLQESNVGPAKNSIRLLSYPTTKYIAYLDGDDYWTDPYKLQKQVDFLETNESFSFCFHNVQIVDEYSQPIFNISKRNWKSQFFDRNEIIFGSYLFYTNSLVFRNKLKLPASFEKIFTGDKALQIYLGILGNGYCSSEIMSAYREHSMGVSKTNKFFTSSEKIESLSNSILIYDNLEFFQQISPLSKDSVLRLNIRISLLKELKLLYKLNLAKRISHTLRNFNKLYKWHYIDSQRGSFISILHVLKLLHPKIEYIINQLLFHYFKRFHGQKKI